MSSHLEILIQEQLLVHDVNQVCENMLQHLKSSDVASPDEIQTISLFIFRSGNNEVFVKLIHFLFHEKIDYIPWSLICTFASRFKSQLKPAFYQFVKEGVTETRLTNEAARAARALPAVPDISQWLLQRNHELMNRIDQDKAKLMDQLEYFKSQRLFEQEKKVLQRLYKMYPSEDSIKQLYQENQLRYAEDFLNRRSKSSSHKLSHLQKETLKNESNAQFAESLIDESLKHPEIAYELAVSAFIHEEFTAGLKILEESEKRSELTSEMLWLKVELLLASQRHLEVLQLLPNIEQQLASDAETFFATAYFRAQALWGLKQNHLAVEVLEALLDSRPNYRSAQLLLSKWKSS